MRQRRGRGEHAIYWVESRQRFAGAVSLGYDGRKRQRKVVYGKTKREVQQRLAKLAIDCGGTIRPSSRMPLADYLKRWLSDDIKARRAATTHAYYENVVDLHLTPRIGRFTLEQFDHERARRLFADLERNSAGATIAQRCYRILRAALNRAVRGGLIAINPLGRVDAPTYKAGQRRSLTLEQVGALLKGARNDPLEALYVLAVTTGMRQGELFALRWDAIDLEAGALSVTGNLQSIGSELVVQAPKTPRSRRRVLLTRLAVAALRRRRAIVDRDAHRSPFVFVGPDGGLPRKANVMRRSFRPLLERAEIPAETTFHALRHTAASVLLLQGSNPNVVSELLGHADVRLTLNTYSDVLPGLQRQAADAMEGAIRAASRKKSKADRLSPRLSVVRKPARPKTGKSPK